MNAPVCKLVMNTNPAGLKNNKKIILFYEIEIVNLYSVHMTLTGLDCRTQNA